MVVLGPDAVEVFAVDEAKHLVEHTLRRVDAIGRVVRIEKNADFLRERPAKPIEEVPVGRVLVAGLVEPLVVRVLGKVEEEALGFHAPADGLADEATSLHHSVGA